MSLRDWFAGHAPSPVVDRESYLAIGAIAKKTGKTVAEILAEAAYQHADAMLKARNQTQV